MHNVSIRYKEVNFQMCCELKWFAAETDVPTECVCEGCAAFRTGNF